jgi:hypothetical protein
VISGNIGTLAEGREKAVAAFKVWGVKPEDVFRALGVGGMADIMLDHIITLRAMFSAIKNQEATVEEYFYSDQPAHQIVRDPLKDDAPGEGDQGGEDAGGRKLAAQTEKRTSAPETSGGKQSGEELALDNPRGTIGAGRAAAQPAVAAQPKPKNDQKRQPEPAGTGTVTPEVNDDAIEQAEKEGWECADMGMSKRTLPDEYRGKLLEKAWLRGYDKRVAEDSNR